MLIHGELDALEPKYKKSQLLVETTLPQRDFGKSFQKNFKTFTKVDCKHSHCDGFYYAQQNLNFHYFWLKTSQNHTFVTRISLP
jgi:hypothetical protein